MDFREGTEISTAELETAAPEHHRAMGSRVVWRSLATPGATADPERRPAPWCWAQRPSWVRLCPEETVWPGHRRPGLGHRNTKTPPEKGIPPRI